MGMGPFFLYTAETITMMRLAYDPVCELIGRMWFYDGNYINNFNIFLQSAPQTQILSECIWRRTVLKLNSIQGSRTRKDSALRIKY